MSAKFPGHRYGLPVVPTKHQGRCCPRPHRAAQFCSFPLASSHLLLYPEARTGPKCCFLGLHICSGTQLTSPPHAPPNTTTPIAHPQLFTLWAAVQLRPAHCRTHSSHTFYGDSHQRPRPSHALPLLCGPHSQSEGQSCPCRAPGLAREASLSGLLDMGRGLCATSHQHPARHLLAPSPP